MKKTYLERVIIFGDPSNAHGLSADFFAGICLFPEHFIRFRIFISFEKMKKKEFLPRRRCVRRVWFGGV